MDKGKVLIYAVEGDNNWTKDTGPCINFYSKAYLSEIQQYRKLETN